MVSSSLSSLSLLLILGTFWIAITTTLIGTSTAFTIPSRSSYSSSSASSSSSSLYAASQQNIDDAMAATEKYGIKSSEARLAWEVVEECDASTNDAAAYTPGDNEAPKNTMTEEEMKDKMEQLMINCSIPKLLADQQLREDVMAELKSIKLMPSKQQPKPKIAGLLASKIKARAISKQYGNASTESKLAWEEVEEIASSGLSNAIGQSLTAGEECDLEQAAEACMALEELDRFLTSGSNSSKQ